MLLKELHVTGSSFSTNGFGQYFPDHIIVPNHTGQGNIVLLHQPCTSFTVLLIVAFSKYQSLDVSLRLPDVLTHISILMLL